MPINLTQVEHSSERDLIFHMMSPFITTTCWPAGPMPLGWPTIQPGGHVQLGHAPLREDASSDRPGSAPRGPPHNVGGATPCCCLKCSRTSRPGTRVSTFRLEACDASHGIREGFLDLLPPLKPSGNRRKVTSGGWLEKRHHLPPGKCIGKTSSYKLFKYCIPSFESFVFSFLATCWRIGYFS